MLALIFAVVSLTSVDPDPVATPAALIGQHLPSSTGFAPGGLPQAGLTPGVDVTGVCPFQSPGFAETPGTDEFAPSFGASPIGAALGASAFGQPLLLDPGSDELAGQACGSSGFGSPLGFSSLVGFGSPFGSGSPYGFVSPFGYSSISSPTMGGRVVRLDPGALRSATLENARFQSMLGDRLRAEPGAEFRSIAGFGDRRSEPYELRDGPGFEAVPFRRH